MSEVPPSTSLRPQLIAWLLSSTVLPALPFLFFRARALDAQTLPGFIIVAVIAQFACSILLAQRISHRRGKGAAHVVLLSLVLMIASVMIGSAAFFGACVGSNVRMDFR